MINIRSLLMLSVLLVAALSTTASATSPEAQDVEHVATVDSPSSTPTADAVRASEGDALGFVLGDSHSQAVPDALTLADSPRKPVGIPVPSLCPARLPAYAVAESSRPPDPGAAWHPAVVYRGNNGR